MRIIAGAYKGKKIAFAETEGLRPTKDRVRENIFNLLSGGLPGFFQDKRVGDIFAGTGALGLEALSRGAKSVVFVENNPDSLKLLRQNIELLGSPSSIILLPGKAQAVFKTQAREPLDILFLDPPYGFPDWRMLFEILKEKGWIQQSTLLVLEQDRRESLLKDIQILKEKTYGRTRVIIGLFPVAQESQEIQEEVNKI